MLEDIKKMLMSLKQDRLCFRVAFFGNRKHFTTIFQIYQRCSNARNTSLGYIPGFRKS
jgi:hypothetical protein